MHIPAQTFQIAIDEDQRKALFELIKANINTKEDGPLQYFDDMLEEMPYMPKDIIHGFCY